MWTNILHFRKTSILTFTGAIAILDPLLLAQYHDNNGGGSAWRALAHTGASVQDFVYTPLDGTSASTVIAHAFNGVSGGDPLPASMAIVVTLRTALRGKSHRGRVYAGPHIESDNDGSGNPAAALITAEAVQWTNFLTALSGSGVTLVVASYLHSTAENVTSVSVDTRWDTQRRRLNA